MTFLHHLIPAIVVTLLLTLEGQARPSATDSLLIHLDSAIKNRSDYESKRHSDAESARLRLDESGNDTSRYEALKTLYGVYEGFQLDSALNVAYRLNKFAKSMGDARREMESEIILAVSRSNSGDPRHALVILDNLKRRDIDKELREMLYSAYFTAYHTLESSEMIETLKNEAGIRAQAYRDSLIGVLPEGSVGHTYLSAAGLDSRGMTRKAIEMLEKGEDNPDFYNNAAFQFGLGSMLLKTGRRNEAIDCMARASLLDITDGKKEYMSMITLAALLCEEGDIHRAFNYIRCALEDAGYSHAEIRTSEIMEVMPIIDSAYRAYEESQINNATRNALIAIGFGVAMCIGLCIVWLQLRRISTIRRQLDISNKQLTEQNLQLAHADSLKLKHIDDLLSLQAANIANIKSYRKNLHRMMTAGQYARVTDRLKSDKPASEEVKAFYDKFDSTFLSIFPEFISEVNDFMKEPVRLDSPGILSPELRIIALMKLGVTATSQIAAMLQYSSQTVYNYRSVIRSALNCPLEEFEKRIATDADIITMKNIDDIN